MFFFFVCGEHTFRKQVDGYEGMVCQCYNCGNMAGHVIKSHPWFTFCWIVSPLTPLPQSHARSCPRKPKLTAPFCAARPPPIDEGPHRRRLQHLQLRPTPREQTRRHGHGRRENRRRRIPPASGVCAPGMGTTAAAAASSTVPMSSDGRRRDALKGERNDQRSERRHQPPRGPGELGLEALRWRRDVHIRHRVDVYDSSSFSCSITRHDRYHSRRCNDIKRAAFLPSCGLIRLRSAMTC